MREAAVISRGCATDVKRCVPEYRGFEAPHESRDVERCVDWSPVEQDELQVRGRTPHVKHIGCICGIVSWQRLNCIHQARVADPRCEIERLHLEHRHRSWFAGRLIEFTRARLTNHVHWVQPHRLGLQFQVDAYVGSWGNEHVQRQRCVSRVHDAEADFTGR